ncbi:hypothetical protein AAC387_Pa07g2939 [Persea americana]
MSHSLSEDDRSRFDHEEDDLWKEGSVGLQSLHPIASARVCVFRLEKNRVAGILRGFIMWIGLDWTMDEGKKVPEGR